MKLLILTAALLCLSKVVVSLNTRETATLSHLMDTTMANQITFTQLMLNRAQRFQLTDMLESESFLVNETIYEVFDSFRDNMQQVLLRADQLQQEFQAQNHAMARCLNSIRKAINNALFDAGDAGNKFLSFANEVVAAYQEFIFTKIEPKVMGEEKEITDLVSACFAENTIHEELVQTCIEGRAQDDDTRDRALEIFVYVSVSFRSGHMQTESLRDVLSKWAESNEGIYEEKKDAVEICSEPRIL